jgi:hypothetical protein
MKAPALVRSGETLYCRVRAGYRGPSGVGPNACEKTPAHAQPMRRRNLRSGRDRGVPCFASCVPIHPALS